MRIDSVKRILAAAAAAACLSASPALLGAEEFQGKLIKGGMGHPSEAVMNIKISVDSYTTPEEARQLIEIQNQSGSEAFMGAFRSLEKGIFYPVGRRGVKIVLHAAQNIPTEKGRRILLVTGTQNWDPDTTQRIDGRFPFMVIELNINRKGNGDGKIYDQAQIVLNQDGSIEMESYNTPPKQIFALRLVK
jgi:hypothetical protein